MGCTNKNKNYVNRSSPDLSSFRCVKDARIAEATKRDMTTESVSSVTTSSSSSSSCDSVPSTTDENSTSSTTKNTITPSTIQEKVAVMLLDIEREQRQDQQQELQQQQQQQQQQPRLQRDQVRVNDALKKLKEQMQELQEMLPSLRLEPSQDASSATSSPTSNAPARSSNEKTRGSALGRDRNSTSNSSGTNRIKDIAQRAKRRRRQLQKEDVRISGLFGPHRFYVDGLYYSTPNYTHTHRNRPSFNKNSERFFFVPGSHSHRPLPGRPFPPPTGTTVMGSRAGPGFNRRTCPPWNPMHQHGEYHHGIESSYTHRWDACRNSALIPTGDSNSNTNPNLNCQAEAPMGHSILCSPGSRAAPIPRDPPLSHPSPQGFWGSMPETTLLSGHPYSSGSAPEPKIPDFVYPLPQQPYPSPSTSPLTSTQHPPPLFSPLPCSLDPKKSHNPGPLTASRLAFATPEAQKEMIGDQLYHQISYSNPALAGRITGIILESGDCYELLNLLESPEELLGDRVAEVLRVLEDHRSPPVIPVGMEC